MATRQGRDLAPEVVQGLNEELDELRGLYVPRDTALEGLYTVVKGVKKDFGKALKKGEPPVREPSRPDQLIEVASSLPAILEQRADFGAKAQSFMEKLHGLIITKKDGTPITGSINPLFVDHDYDPERNYTGDKRSVPRIYLRSDHIEGRVTDIQGQEPSAEEPGVWVWPTGVKLGKWGDWHTGRGPDPEQAVSLLDESVEFVEHIEGCKLPRPEQRDRQYQLTMD